MSEFSRDALSADIEHDYSTGDEGVVPLSRRRSRYHFIALWVTLAAGFTYLFLGFQFHDAGYSLGRSVLVGGLGGLCYILYAIPAAYLGSRTGQTHALLTGVGIAIGSVMWGNEPDTWRYGKPRVLWPLPAYAIAVFVGLILFVAGGWMMAELSGAGQYDFGPAFEYTVKYSLFGALWLGAIVATILQVAVNDGNYYEMVNGGQNLVGQARGWRRWHTCLLMALFAALFTWWFPHLENGFFKVAGWSAIALPSVTVVMCVDQFVLPRFSGVRRPVDTIPSWRDAGLANWPGIVAVLAALLFGAWGLQLFPGQTSAPPLGLVPVEAWLIAGVGYFVLGLLTSRSTQAAGALAFTAKGR